MDVAGCGQKGELMVKRVVAGELVHEKSAFGEMLERKSVEKNAERKKVRTALYASDYGQCPRKVFFAFYPEVFPAEEIDGRVARIFANGEAVHERLQGYLAREEGLQFQSELTVPRDELQVHGRCDGTAMFEGGVCILEFKSINKAVVDEPKSEHVGQLMWYMGMFERRRSELRKEFGLESCDIVVDVGALVSKSGVSAESLPDIEKQLLQASGPVRGEVIYESKQNQSIFTFPVEFDERKFAVVKAWFEGVKNAVESGVRPSVRYKPQYYPCFWSGGRCPYFDACHGEGDVGDHPLVTLGISPKRLQDDGVFK